MVRTENNRYIPHRRFWQIVYAYAEAAAHISHITIFIYRRQQAETVYSKDFRIPKTARLLCIYLRITYNLASLKQLHYLLKMTLPYHMRGNYNLPIRMFFKIRQENLFIRQPRTTC